MIKFLNQTAKNCTQYQMGLEKYNDMQMQVFLCI